MPDLNIFKEPVSTLSGIGVNRAKAMARIGLNTYGDLLYHFPRAYQNRGNIKLLSEVSEGEVCALLLTVSTEPKTVILKKRMTLTKFSAFDESQRCIITFFNQEYTHDIFTVGSTFRFWGKVSLKSGIYALSSPAFEPYFEDKPLPEFIPIYPLTEGITQKIISSSIAQVLTRCSYANPDDIIPDEVRDKYDLCPLIFGFEAIHFPSDYSMINKARSRFVFEELFLLSVSIALMKSRVKSGTAPIMEADDDLMQKFYSELPFRLTGAQSRAINDIKSDLLSETHIPMSRLVSGDVGSGKTVCAAAAAYISAANEYQTALMAPTEILAVQHYNDLKSLFENFGVSCALLTGSLKASEKRSVREKLKSGDIDIIIGTHALISNGVEFKNLGLVITDEQHRFGVMQRAALAERGKSPHVLVMSATPIPRTLALILYGDLDVSVIDELPPGRQKVDTYIVNESYRERLNNFIRKHVEAGRQVYIVCPAVEKSESDDEGEIIKFDYGYTTESAAEAASPIPLKSAVEYAGKLQNEVFTDRKVALIHGKMKGTEKEKIMREFADRQIDILVSTTVIEVGVNVPNATLMIVENAERFGLSQLHQLRGRVGRGTYKSYCILVSNTGSETALKRLEVMKSTGNGYKIAEKDLELRGPGDFLPSSNEARQHGGFKFRLANLCDDMELLKKAYQAAKDTVESDPLLKDSKNASLRRTIANVFSINENYFN